VTAPILEAPEDKERLARRQEAEKGRCRPVLHGIVGRSTTEGAPPPAVIPAYLSLFIFVFNVIGRC
jgi:hypothetical protein